MKIFLWLMLLLPLGQAGALTLEELKLGFETKKLKLEEKQAMDLESLSANYLKALGKLQLRFQKAGRLDDSLTTDKEQKLIANKTWPLPPLAGSVPAKLKAARKLYIRSYIDHRRDTGRSMIKLADRMDELLASKVTSLTKEGDLEGATKARSHRETLAADKNLVETRAFLKRVGADGSAKVAMRLRRAGDSLEVDVRYDAGGKVSLQSPIENVIEISGGKGEKGKTKAQRLGDFLGSKGYTVDPYLAMAKEFNDDELGALKCTSMTPKFRVKEVGETGARFVVDQNARNIHFSMGDLLPVVGADGTYKVSIRYFVPKSNKLINGIKFVQAGAGPIPESLSTKIGKWTDFNFISPSRTARPRLLMYLNTSKKAPQAQLAGESIVISSIKVSHVRVSAYQVRRYDFDGGLVDEIIDPAQQKILALNGVLTTTQ